jgi:DNA-binding XRE family transcriptional regulator
MPTGSETWQGYTKRGLNVKKDTKQAKRCDGALNQISVDLTGNFAYTVDMLRQYRLKLNISQEQLANEIGISVRTLRDIECGKKRPGSPLIQASIEAWVKEVRAQERMATKGI